MKRTAAKVPRVGGDPDESTESKGMHSIPKFSGDPDEEYAPTIVQPPWWSVVSAHTREDNQTRFLNTTDDSLFGKSDFDAEHLSEVEATLTVRDQATQHKVLDLSQKHVVVSAETTSLTIGTAVDVSLRFKTHSVTFQSLLLSKMTGTTPSLGLHLSTLSRSQLTALILLLDDVRKAASSARTTPRISPRGRAIAAALILGASAAIGVALRPSPVTVRVVHAERSVLVDAVTSLAPGEILPSKTATIRSTSIAPRVFTPAVKKGDRVKSGDIVARGDDPELLRAVTWSRGQVAKLDAELRQRTTSASSLDGESARSEEVETARAALANARFTLAAREREVAQLTVVAPIDGIVLALHAKGAAVPPAGALIEIADDSSPTARIPFAESDVASINIGANVDLTVPGLEKKLTGKISRLGSIVETTAEGRAVWAELTLPEDPRVRLGSSVTAKVPMSEPQRALLIDAAAVDTARGGAHVVLLIDGRASERSVEIGAHVGNRVEIRSGIDEDALVVANPYGIAHGQRIVRGAP